MDTIVLIFGLFCIRYLLYSMSRFLLAQRKKLIWMSIIFVVACISAGLPKFLIMKEILSNTTPNNLVAVFSFFYMPYVLMSIASKQRSQER